MFLTYEHANLYLLILTFSILISGISLVFINLHKYIYNLFVISFISSMITFFLMIILIINYWIIVY